MLPFHDFHCPAPLSCAPRAHGTQYTPVPGPTCMEREWVPAWLECESTFSGHLQTWSFIHDYKSAMEMVQFWDWIPVTELLLSHGVDIEENGLCNPESQKSPCPLYIPKETAPTCMCLCSLTRPEAPGRQKLRLNHHCIRHMDTPNENKFPTSECPSF